MAILVVFAAANHDSIWKVAIRAGEELTNYGLNAEEPMEGIFLPLPLTQLALHLLSRCLR